MLTIAVQNAKQNLQLEHASGLLEFGRGPQRPGSLRCVIEDVSVSRDHLQVEELATNRVRLLNLSQRVPVELADGGQIPCSETRELPLPVRIVLGKTQITLTRRPMLADTDTLPEPAPSPVTAVDRINHDFAAEGFQTIAKPVRPSARLSAAAASAPLGTSPTPEVLTQWMETILALQRSDSETGESQPQAARALVSMIGLDVGLVITYRDGNWKVIARAARDDDGSDSITGREFSQTVLHQVLSERRTFYQDLDQMRAQESLRSVDAVVVSPIFGSNEEIVGVLYGLRRSRGRNRLLGVKITPLEAQLVQLLAAAVGTNLARGEATRTRTQFEQFFSPELVRHLARDTGLLACRDTPVTILFADVRSFSKHSERLGAEVVGQWMHDVLSQLSDAVRDEVGVLVDYVGDELMAMWGAPEEQPDQALRAVRAALAMHAALPGLNQRWQPSLGEPMRIGVGVNSGQARVGNIGSKTKFKYGPLGNTVNLASRVQGLTKYLQCGLLVTAATWQQLGEGYVARRVVRTRVVNIQKPVDLYEVERVSTPERQLFFAEAQATLEALEAGHFADAARMAGTLLVTNPSDGALMLTLARSAQALVQRGEGFDPVWVPPGK